MTVVAPALEFQSKTDATKYTYDAHGRRVRIKVDAAKSLTCWVS